MRKIILLLVFAAFAVSIRAQTVAPPIVEYPQSKVSDVFELRNESETEPMIVTGLMASAFTVDNAGTPTFTPIDPTKIAIRWSENSMRIPPLGRHEIFVDMKCLQSKVCWACINIAISRGRNAQGVAVTLLLPHVIYLGHGSIKRKEAQVKFVDTHSFIITNTGNGLDRPLIELWTDGGKKTFGAPIFPNGARLVISESPITRVRIKFAKFKLDEKQ
jgi:hypothetical protein